MLLLSLFFCFSSVAQDQYDKARELLRSTNDVDFGRDIKPILAESCLRCHGPAKPRSSFRLDNRDSALKGGDSGVDILPGDAANSPLIAYVSGADPDMQMPPKGKGEPLTSNQVAILRQWIDQGANWEAAQPAPPIANVTPIVGFTEVTGNAAKFREQYWQKDGWNPGVEFELAEDLGGRNGTFKLDGHFLPNDYLIRVARDRPDLGFIRGGWQQYWKYYDDAGGYDPLSSPSLTRLNRDLHLNIGSAWVDFGLTLPDWPRMVLGYEYQYRHGEEATLEWGNITLGGRNILPASARIKEDTHIIKFDLDYDIAGFRIEDSFRGEFYRLDNTRTNVFVSDIFNNLNAARDSETYSHFQGANSIRVERQFNDWLFGSAGYLYSHLDGVSSINSSTTDQSGTGFNNTWQSQSITLERQSHVGNVNAMFRPWDNLTLSTGVQAEWTDEQGFGNNTLSAAFTTLPATVFPVQQFSDMNTQLVEENAALRYSGIAYTSLFAEGRLRQESIGQSMGQTGDASLLYNPEFALNTDFTSQMYDWRLGFNTSPLTWLSLGAHYRQYDDKSDYDHTRDESPLGVQGLGYPGFIRSRDLLTDEVEGRLTLRPMRWLKTTFSAKFFKTDYTTDTDSASFGPAFIITPGGELLAGRSDAQLYSANLSLTPWQRLYLSSTFSLQHSSTETFANNNPSVAPYRGDVYNVLNTVTYVLDNATDLLASYDYSSADFLQDNFADGVVTGMRYHRHGLRAGLTHRFGKNLLARLQYGYFKYDEPSSGGAGDYRAHSILAMLTVKLP